MCVLYHCKNKQSTDSTCTCEEQNDTILVFNWLNQKSKWKYLLVAVAELSNFLSHVLLWNKHTCHPISKNTNKWKSIILFARRSLILLSLFLKMWLCCLYWETWGSLVFVELGVQPIKVWRSLWNSITRREGWINVWMAAIGGASTWTVQAN